MASFGGAETCVLCSKKVYVTERINVGDLKTGPRYSHKTCLKCATCSTTLNAETFASYEGQIFCKKHLREKFSSTGTTSSSSTTAKPVATSSVSSAFNAKVEKDYCPACSKVVYLNEKICVDDKLIKKTYHKSCFRCNHCYGILSLQDYVCLDGALFCKPHFRELYQSKGKLDFAESSRNMTRSMSFSGRARASINSALETPYPEPFGSPDTAVVAPIVPLKSHEAEAPNAMLSKSVEVTTVQSADDKAMDAWSKKFHRFMKFESETDLAAKKSPSATSTPVKETPKEPVKAPETQKEPVKPQEAPKEPVKTAPAHKELVADIEKGVPLKETVTEDKSAPKMPTPGTSTADVRHVMEELEKTRAKKLQHVEEKKDSSAPVIDPNVHIKKNERGELLAEIAKGTDLQKTETTNKAAPVIDANVHIKTVDRTGFLTEVKTGTELSHPEQIRDSSAPKLPTATKANEVRHVMEELEKTGPKHLKPAETTHDSSAPKIDENVHIKKTDTRKELAEEIQKGTALEHTETKDRSAPVIEPSVHISKNQHGELRKEIATGTVLSPVAEVHDASAPKIPTATKPETVKEVLKEMQDSKPALVQPAVVKDRSAPVIEANVHVQTIDRDSHLQEIQKGADLKHPTDAKDRSEPKIDASVHIKESTRPQLNKEIQEKAKEVTAEKAPETTPAETKSAEKQKEAPKVETKPVETKPAEAPAEKPADSKSVAVTSSKSDDTDESEKKDKKKSKKTKKSKKSKK